MQFEHTLSRLQGFRSGVREELKGRLAVPLQDAVALSALAAPGEAETVLQSLIAAANTLKSQGEDEPLLQSRNRYLLAAWLVAAHRDPLTVPASLQRGRDLWARAGLRRVEPFASAALMVMDLVNGGATLDSSAYDAVKRSFDRLKSDHFWLVGNHTLPFAALAYRAPSQAVEAVSGLYTRLIEGKFEKGADAFNAAIAAVYSAQDDLGWAERMIALKTAFRERRLNIESRRYLDFAFLAMTLVDPEMAAETVLQLRDEIRAETQGLNDRQGAAVLIWLQTALSLSAEDLPHLGAPRRLLSAYMVLSAKGRLQGVKG